MTEANRANLRRIMLMAWEFYRTARRAAELRSFSDCLKGAWKMMRGLREAAAQIRGVKSLRLSKELIRSPIARAHGEGSLRDFHGAYLTAQLGQ